MENLISVIVITYNQELTIGRTLESILHQRCHLPLEIIIGEDASIDGTRKICETYAERYPEVVKLMEKAPNKGIMDNYFDCLLACKGKYIADCAGDDYWTDPEKLEKEVRILEREPDVTLVHTAWQYLDEQTGETLSAPPAPFPAPRTDGQGCSKPSSRKWNNPLSTYARHFTGHPPYWKPTGKTPVSSATSLFNVRTCKWPLPWHYAER